MRRRERKWTTNSSSIVVSILGDDARTCSSCMATLTEGCTRHTLFNMLSGNHWQRTEKRGQAKFAASRSKPVPRTVKQVIWKLAGVATDRESSMVARDPECWPHPDSSTSFFVGPCHVLFLCSSLGTTVTKLTPQQPQKNVGSPAPLCGHFRFSPHDGITTIRQTPCEQSAQRSIRPTAPSRRRCVRRLVKLSLDGTSPSSKSYSGQYDHGRGG
jgi:hypothetical protein